MGENKSTCSLKESSRVDREELEGENGGEFDQTHCTHVWHSQAIKNKNEVITWEERLLGWNLFAEIIISKGSD